MFYNYPQDFKTLEPSPGFLIRLVWGQRLMFSHVTLQPHSKVSLHTHSQEQKGVVLEGEFEMTIGDETRLIKKDDMYLIPADTAHGCVTHTEPALTLDVFSPPREDYVTCPE